MKKLTILLLFIITGFESFAQLPTIKAIGDEKKEVNWAEIKKQEESEDGPGFFYNDCGQEVIPIKASSVLSPQGKFNYSIKNLTDPDPMTAWAEGKPGYGIGEWFEVKAVNINIIYNGYQYSPKKWLENSRVKKFKIYLDKKPVCFLELSDQMGAQHFELPPPQRNLIESQEYLDLK